MGGVYSTPGTAGSKSGSPIAGAWFALVYNGYNGFNYNPSSRKCQF